MRKLVIGCGYLGRRVAARWRSESHDVFALTRSERHADELRAAGIEPIVGDVTLSGTLPGLPAVDTVLYAVGFDRGAAKSYREVYVSGLENVLREIHGRVARLIYISSTSVYGQSSGEWIDESSPAEPVTPNGQVCLDAERVVREYFPSAGSNDITAANVLRLAGIYGPGRLLRRVEALKSGDLIPGNPEGWLNLIHVDDAAVAVDACEQRGKPGQAYLICDDKPVRRREYYNRLADLVGAARPVFEASDESTGRTHGAGKRCRNHQMRTELAVRLDYPTFETGLPHAARETPNQFP